MTGPIDNEAIRAAASLWETGFAYLIDSGRVDQSFRDRAEAAEKATGLFIAAQSQALIGIEKHLAEMADLQRQALAVAALGTTGATRDHAEWLAARDIVHNLLNLTPETPKS
ncbi:hypothetical protein GV792_04865 [Nocardia cyriacigeorgica]|uniref:hypothetical protein n=1 Tax=Nocardia cyriacigeorgica TaxID=135487 RepID=UPI0013B8DF5C|nr:hypothetical protein [Nocardia cyriacigeorgica]NEW49375.1 hypothetical protein [Nocardia cyriacigeorgica]